jgi:hypothetical protein
MRFSSLHSRGPIDGLTAKLLSVSALALGVGAALAQSNSPSAEAAASQLIHSFARASDRRDAAALEGILHPAFRVVFTLKPGAAPTTLDRAQYLQMLREGKIGGADRQVAVSGVAISGGFASASAEMLRPDAVFSGTYALIEQAGRWMLLQEAVRMGPAVAAK